MNKKIVLICIIVLFLVFISAVAFYHSGYRYDKLVVNEDTWNKIISEREMSDTNLITSIKFNEYDLLYDNVNCTYYYSLVENDNNKYNPIVKYKTNKNDLQIVIDKKITDELIESNGCINVMLYNDTEFSIYGLRCSTLPLLNISSPDMSEVSKQRDVDINLSLFDNRKDSVKRLTVSEGKCM